MQSAVDIYSTGYTAAVAVKVCVINQTIKIQWAHKIARPFLYEAKDNEEIKSPKSEASSALASPSQVISDQTIKKLEWQVQHEKDLG